jgi:hypothetical protein
MAHDKMRTDLYAPAGYAWEDAQKQGLGKTQRVATNIYIYIIDYQPRSKQRKG